MSVQRKKRKAEVRFRRTAEGVAFRALKMFYERIGVVKNKDGLERLAQKFVAVLSFRWRCPLAVAAAAAACCCCCCAGSLAWP